MWFKYNLSLFGGATFGLNVYISRLVPLRGTICLKYTVPKMTPQPLSGSKVKLQALQCYSRFYFPEYKKSYQNVPPYIESI